MFKRIYVEITNVCNLHCSFCPGTSRAPHVMSTADFRQLAQKLQGHTHYLYLHVLGEPLGHPQLAEILDIAHEYGFRICLTTNGTLLPEKSDILLAAPALHKVSISLHSFEANSGIDLPGYLDGVWDFCTKAAQGGILCALRLWNEGGLEQLNDSILYYLSQKIQNDIKNILPDAAGNRRLLPRIFLERAEKFDWPSLSAPLCNTQFCHALHQQLAVLCDGTVVPCCLDGEGNVPLGNLFEEELSHILSAPRSRAMRSGFSKRQPSEELCRRCGYATRFNK